MFNSSLFQTRRQKLVEQLADNALLVLFSGVAPHMSRDASYPFHVNRNFYYLTGLDRENMALLIAKKNGAVSTTAFIEIVDPLEEKWTGKRMRAEEAKSRSGIDNIDNVTNLQDVFARLLVDGAFDTLYLDIEQSGWSQTATAAHRFAQEIGARYPTLQLKNVYPQICRLRSVKDADEVNAIRKAIQITKDGIENMMKNAQPGNMEYEIEADFDYALARHGVREHAFPSIIASGERATILHYVENNMQTGETDLVLCDLGASYSYYSADITRTFPVSGQFTARQKQLYEIVLLAMDQTIAAIKLGMTYKELNDVTRATLARELKKINLITNDEELSNYYYHGVSHPLGLDTHDVGGREWPIEAGTVLTIEPGLYIAEEGIGIRIEDDVLVTEQGVENLSADIIKRVADIEAFMRNKS